MTQIHKQNTIRKPERYLRYDQPTGKTDAIAMQHDVDYSVCKDDRKFKNKADRKMVKECDKEFIKNLDHSEI